MPYHVYELYDPIEHEVRYVGCTDSPKRRLKQHLRQPCNPAMALWLASLSEQGESPRLHVRDSFDDLHEAVSAETERIKALGIGGRLLNLDHNPCPPATCRAMIDLKRLSTAVRTKRGNRSMRDVADEVGLAIGTLSNLEREAIADPDLSTMLKICDWTGLPVEYFRIEVTEKAA